MPATLRRTDRTNAAPSGRSSSVPTPKPGESQPQFAIRFHEAMQRRMPDTDQRNRACFAAWDRASDNPVERLARKRFASDRFTRIKAVPYFATHVAEEDAEYDEQGNQTREASRKRYDRGALVKIVLHNNDRAEDLDNWCPICEGHTPTADQYEAGAKAPEVVGYAGNYRLGMVGRKRPKWCVFADEWHHNENADALRKLPRRSVEIWDDGTIDPVAALGATTPRLEIGMTRFYRDPVRGMVRKYAAAPASSNVYAPGMVRAKTTKRRYAAGGTMALSQEDVSQIVNAVMETEPMQWVQSQMRDSPDRVEGDDDLDADLDGGEDDLGDDLSGDEGDDLDMEGDAEGDDLSGEEADDDPDQYGDDGDDFDIADEDGLDGESAAGPVMDAGDALGDDELADMDDEERADYDGMDDADKAVYAKGYRRGRGRGKRTKPGRTRPMKLSRQASRKGETDAQRYARAAKARRASELKEREVKSLRATVAKLARESRHAKRYARLEEKRSEGFVFDVEEELADVADVSDAQFEQHLGRIAKRYSRAPVGGGDLPVFSPPAPRNQQQKDTYSRRRAARAVEISTAEGIAYPEALNRADAELVGK